MPVTLCPIALAAGCAKCPVFKVCPLKGVIGDQRPAAPAPKAAESAPKPGGKPKSGKGDARKAKSRPSRRGRR
ncbi:MAG: hypothetical protein U1F51_03915 [Burkholderiales bacterium]|jgi:hypothetical protein